MRQAFGPPLGRALEIPVRRFGEAEAIYSRTYTRTRKLVLETEWNKLVVRAALRFGKPYEEIVRHGADGKASLIIMTARGGDAVDRAIFGSTTYRVIQLGPCPVLAIHT